MKKTAKKLSLSRETLSLLESHLENVAGGVTIVGQTCNTCLTCGQPTCVPTRD
jgi:hypothetical protein